jgi:dihydropteroate synthase
MHSRKGASTSPTAPPARKTDESDGERCEASLLTPGDTASVNPGAKLMGVVNVTPDSFSDGGEFLDAEAAIAHGRELVAEGADILDVGGESTRPGADAVPAEAERERVEPVVAGLAGSGAVVSIDTSKALVAGAALDAGARIVNDVTALRADPDLAGLCAERGCGVVLMHMLGDPRTMQKDPRYDDVVDDVKAFLAERVEFALAAGVSEGRIWVDPGIGFGKTVEHNLELIRRLGELRELGRPIVFGSSRKSFIGKLTGAEVDERLGGTVASNVLAYAQGAEVLRVHDVAPLREALTVAAAILSPERAAAVRDR